MGMSLRLWVMELQPGIDQQPGTDSTFLASHSKVSNPTVEMEPDRGLSK